MAEEPASHHQGLAAHHRVRGVGVPEIVEADVVGKAGFGPDATPNIRHAHARFGEIIGARKDEGRLALTLSTPLLEQVSRDLTEQHRSRSGLAVSEIQAVSPNLLPAQSVDLAGAAAREQDQSYDVNLIAADKRVTVKHRAEAL
ncbi:MAG: hypothetical protein AAF950_17375 [Pseudomonadota bacterium]